MKIVIIGAGSVFGKRLSQDILTRNSLRGSTIALCDINPRKLKVISDYLKKVVKTNNLDGKIEASMDRKQLLKGADFVILAVAIGGPAYYGFPYEQEWRIPRKYGLTQTVADTTGVGAVFRALRTAPEMIRMVEDINRLAPKATILNYVNPMAVLTNVLTRHSNVPFVGLCHSVQHTHRQLSSYMGLPQEEVGYWVAGINHMAWFLKLTHQDRDAYPMLRRAMKKNSVFQKDHIRFEIMRHFGYFVTESSYHMSEYVPYFQHEPHKMRKKGETTKSFKRIKAKRDGFITEMERSLKLEKIALVQSPEYASDIMHAITTGEAFRIAGNFINHGYISNLPEGCTVEVPAMVDGEGLHPCGVGELPRHLAALCQSNVSPQMLVVDAILNHSKEAAYQAVLLDPAAGASLSLTKMKKMFEELWKVEAKFLTSYR